MKNLYLTEINYDKKVLELEKGEEYNRIKNLVINSMRYSDITYYEKENIPEIYLNDIKDLLERNYDTDLKNLVEYTYIGNVLYIKMSCFNSSIYAKESVNDSIVFDLKIENNPEQQFNNINDLLDALTEYDKCGRAVLSANNDKYDMLLVYHAE